MVGCAFQHLRQAGSAGALVARTRNVEACFVKDIRDRLFRWNGNSQAGPAQFDLEWRSLHQGFQLTRAKAFDVKQFFRP